MQTGEQLTAALLAAALSKLCLKQPTASLLTVVAAAPAFAAVHRVAQELDAMPPALELSVHIAPLPPCTLAPAGGGSPVASRWPAVSVKRPGAPIRW